MYGTSALFSVFVLTVAGAQQAQQPEAAPLTGEQAPGDQAPTSDGGASASAVEAVPEEQANSEAAAEQPTAGAVDLGDIADVSELDLDSLLEVEIITAAKTAQKVYEAPAIVAIITRQEIRETGYHSLAEALESVPGLATNTDHVFHNIGVRGISGGIRGGSRHLKFLINGQPVAFRPDAQNLLGPEFIPLSAVEQIEVIRGPASALYGINAFLGVVNIITRKPKSVPGLGLVSGEVGLIRENVSGGGEALLAHRGENYEILIAARILRDDRSGLELPPSSPDFGDYGDNTKGRDDLSQPNSIFVAAAYETEKIGRFKAEAGRQELNAAGEYFDTGALTHTTNINLNNQYLRLAHQWELGFFGIESAFSYGWGGPGGADVILPAVNGVALSQRVRRDFGFEAFTFMVEPRLSWSNSLLILGAEYDVDSENLRQNIFTSPGSGDELPGKDFGEKDFTDFGVYGQILFQEIEDLRLSANVRFDAHNKFGDNFNYRAAAVWSITDWLYLKALSGSSFRAPSPEQLFGTPIKPGGIVGSRAGAEPIPLKPQTALNHEILVGFHAGFATVLVNGFYTTVDKRIEYVRKEGNLQVANLANSTTIGGEVSIRVQHKQLFDLLDIQLHTSAALQHTEFKLAGTFTPHEEEILTLNELFPAWTAKASLNIAIPRLYVNFNARTNIYGPRLQSQTNQSIGRPFIGDPLRQIDVSYPVHLTLSSIGLNLTGRGETVFRLSVYDLFETASEEPGFNGINVPPLGRRVFFSVTQEI